MKYIIDVPDAEGHYDSEYEMVTMRVHYGSTIVDISMDAKPYNEPDRKAIEDEVWELADYMCRMSQAEKSRCFGFSYPSEVTTNLTYQEAKSLFEKWMENENEDEIHVGDEIYCDGDYEKAVVMEIHVDGSVSVYTKNGCIEHWWNKMHNLKKTGRHFDEVAELLKKMRGEEQ